MTTPTFSIGIDIAKENFSVCLLCTAEEEHGKRIQQDFTNDADGIAALLKLMHDMTIERIVLESTGRHQRVLAARLTSAGYPVVVMNPACTRAFARSQGLLAKTDRLDAYALALFAAKIRPEPRPLASKEQQTLGDLVTRRLQLVSMQTAEKNRQQETQCPRALRSIEKHLRWTSNEIAAIEAEIDRLIAANETWAEVREIVEGVPGIGKIVSRTLIGHLPELGSLNRRQITSLVGLAPINRDSGKHRGKRRIGGGRRTVRHHLYLAAMSAVQHNPIIKDHYKQLLDRGKEKKTALIACTRKLLVILNKIVATKEHWDAEHAPQKP
jgi:transposase